MPKCNICITLIELKQIISQQFTEIVPEIFAIKKQKIQTIDASLIKQTKIRADKTFFVGPNNKERRTQKLWMLLTYFVKLTNILYATLEKF